MEDQNNPYRSSEGSGTPEQLELTQDQSELLKKFRQQIHALGGFWILIGGLGVGLGGFTFFAMNMAQQQGQQMELRGMTPDQAKIVLAVAGISGLIFLILGILACLKKIGAVYAGLVLSYLAIISAVLSLNVCQIVMLVLVILQSHRVISWASKLTSQGVSLTRKV